jgi:hypothetical protein
MFLLASFSLFFLLEALLQPQPQMQAGFSLIKACSIVNPDKTVLISPLSLYLPLTPSSQIDADPSGVRASICFD